MTALRSWIRAGAASALLGSAVLAAACSAQNEPATPQVNTAGNRSAATQPECQQMTGADRQSCERRRANPPEQTDPNTVNSTTREAPPPDTTSEADNAADTQNPPQQR